VTNKILIIDDEIAIRESISYFFENKGFFVETAASGVEATNKIQKIGFDVALIDINLPDINGVELLAKLKNLFPDMVYIIITAYSTVQNAIRAVKEGADGYFIKPPILEDVLLRVTDALEKKSLKKQLEKSEKKLRQIFQSIPDIFFLVSDDTTILEFKGREEDLYIPLEGLIGKKLSANLPENLAKITVEYVKKTISTKQPQIQDYCLPIKEKLRYFEARHLYVSESEVAIFIRDVTRRKQAEKLNIIQKDLALRMLETDDLSKNSQILLETIFNATEFDSGGIFLIDNETDSLRLIYCEGISESIIKTVSQCESDDVNWKIIQAGEKFYLNYNKLYNFKKKVGKLKGLKSMAIVPINYSGNVIGCISVASHTIEVISEETKNIIENIVGHVGQTFSRSMLATALKESEDQFRTVSEQALMGICILQDNVIKYVNQQYANILGYTPEELMNLPPFEYVNMIHPEDRKKVFEQAKKKQAGDPDVNTHYQFRGLTKTGKTIWVDNFAQTINYRGKPADLIMVVDITDRKRVEQELMESEEKYRTITEQALMGICIVQNNLIKYANEAMSQITEYTNQEIMSWNTFDFLKLIPANSISFAKKEAIKGQTRQHGLISEKYYKIITKSGKIKWVNTNTKTINYKGRKAALVIFKDVTDEKITEEKLEESEKRYRLITENAHDIICVLDNKFKLEFINEQVQKRILGYDNGELIGKDVLKLIHPDEVTEAVKLYKQNYERMEGVMELRIKKKNGTYIWLELTGKIYTDFDGKEKILVIGRDIGDRKESENLLKESEEKYRQLFEKAIIGIVVINNGRIIMCNDQEAHIFGYSSASDLIGKPVVKLIDRSDQPSLLALQNDILQDRGMKHPVSFKGVHLDGRKLIVEGFAIKFPYISQNSVLAYNIDVTERALSEQKIRESEEKYRLITENANDLIIILDDKNQFEYINEVPHQKLLGYSSKDLLGKSVFEFLQPDDIKRAQYAMTKGIDRGDAKGEIKVKHRNGTYIWFEMRAGRFVDSKGKEKVILVGRDISERKQAEKELKESEEKFRNITEQSLVGIVILQDGHIKYINDAAAKISGYPTQKFLSKSFNDMMKLIHPDDLPYVLNQDMKYRAERKTSLSYRVRIFTKVGEIRWIDQYAKPIKYEGKIADLIMIVDVTDRIETEQRLIESEEKFRSISEQSLMGIAILQDGFIKYVNSATVDIFEYSEKEFLEWNFEEFTKVIHPEDAEFVLEQGRKKQAGDKDVITHYSYRIITKTNKEKWVDQFSQTIIYEGKTADLITLIDITEKKLVENELNTYRKQLEHMVEERTAELVLANKKLEQEIIERKTIEKNLQRQYSIINAINKIFEEMLIRTNEEDISRTCLELAKKLTNSEIGFVGELNRNGRFDTIALSNPSWQDYRVEKAITAKKMGDMEIRGIWERIMNEEAPIIVNDVNLHPDNFITAKGHPPLKNFLGVPLRLMGRTIGMIALANKDSNYTKADQEAIESLSIALVEALIRKKMEAELKRSEEKFKSITNISQEIIVRTDMNGICTFINPAASNFFQKSIEEMHSVKITDYIHPGDLQFAANVWFKILSSGEPVLGFHTRIKVPSGLRTVKWNGSAIRDDTGKVVGVQATGRDVTEIQEELIEKNKLAAVGQLAAGVAHELNTPLANINLTAEYMLNLIKIQKQRSEWQILEDEIIDIKSQVMLCSKIVKELLQFSRRMTLNIKKVELYPIIKELLSAPAISAKLIDKNINILTEVDKDIEIEVDRNLLLQTLQNIIDNAIDAINETNKNPKIKIKVSKINSNAEINVLDNGIGIKESDLPSIFNPFFSTKPVGKGTGLGLAICKSIIEKHGGKIKIKSTYGKGTEVQISLPLEQSQNAK